MSRGWRRVRGTPPNVQTWESAPYDTEVIQADVTGDAQLKHAREQLDLANRYPGRERSLPSGAKVIELDSGKRSPKT